MRATQLAVFAAASLVAAGCSPSGRESSPANVETSAVSSSPSAGEGDVALIGCLQREADYRAVHDAGKGGVLGTGLGVGNEYVLVDARPVPAASDAAPASEGLTAARTYRLTGNLEDRLATAVGRLVEVVGKAGDDESKEGWQTFTVTLSHDVGDFCPRPTEARQ